MRKKGFTLIELLAVIVILAIIALIATPMVLNTIDDAKKGAASSSASSYMSAVETSLTSYMLKNNGQSYATGKYNVAKLKSDLDVQLKGDAPTEGNVCIASNGIVSKASVKVNGYVVNYDGKETKTTDLKEVEDIDCESSVSYSHMVGDAVTIDGIGYHVIKNSSTTDEYVTLLRDESIGDFVFDENGGTDYETSTIKVYLNSTYKDTFGDKKSLINEITLPDFGNYGVSESNPTVGTFKDSEEGTIVYLQKNYSDIFFKFLRGSHTDDTSGLYTDMVREEILTKSLSSSKSLPSTSIIYGMEVLHHSGTLVGNCVHIVTPDGSQVNDAVCSKGASAPVEPGTYKAPVRPVVVISKTALN